MLKPTANVYCYVLLAGVVVSVLSGCGNKGDLFLIPDALTEQELQRLEQPLEPAPSVASPSNGTFTEPTAEDPDDIENSTKKKPSSSN